MPHPYDSTMSRRSLAKALALGAATACSPLASLSAETQAASPMPQSWRRIYPGVWRMRIGTPERFTPVNNRCIPAAESKLAAMPEVAAPVVEHVQAIVNMRGTTVSLPLAAGENLFGLGLQMQSFNQRGKRKTLRVNADPRFDSGDSHAPVPFYVSSKGYGIFVDTARYATFCCGTAQHVKERTSAMDHGAPEEATTLHMDDTARVTVQVDFAQGVDVYLFAGPTMLDAIRRYNLFSGGGVNPPEWGLGCWYRAHGKATDQEVLKLARQFRQRNIPCDVLGLEPGWQTHVYSCSFKWSDRFPAPAKFVQAAAEMHYKVNLWEHAFVHPTAPFHDALASRAGDYQVWGGLAPDFEDKGARRIFGEYHRKTFIDIGISGFKLDECDNSDYTGGWSFPEFSRFPSGPDGEQMHSVFGLRFQQTILEQYQAANVPTYGLVRSSGALAAPYPFVLYSDLYDHRVFVRSLVNSGFSGLLWTPEVRDAANANDLIRRLQTVVFSPMALVNCWYIVNPPWQQQDRDKNNRNELEPGWESLEAQCREILQWRMLLLPYLRAAFARYDKDGTPPFRALLLDDPADARLATCDDQFMVGDRMMVAPLFDGEASRKVIIPPGEWCDFWTGAPVAGGSTVEMPASYRRIPVYVRAGSVFPVGGVANHTTDSATRRLTVRVFGNGSIPFLLTGTGDESLVLTWQGGRGNMQQSGSSRPYSVDRWIAATEPFFTVAPAMKP